MDKVESFKFKFLLKKEKDLKKSRNLRCNSLYLKRFYYIFFIAEVSL